MNSTEYLRTILRLTGAACLVCVGTSAALADWPVCQTTIYTPSTVPVVENANNSQPIEIGTKFRTTAAGNAVGARIYVGASNTGPNVANLWTGSGMLLATQAFPAFTGPGWSQVMFSSAVALTPGQTYVISCYSSSGWYSGTNYAFTSAVVNGPLRGLADGEDGANGLYRYGTGFPTLTYLSTSYFVDVVFESPCATNLEMDWFTIDGGGYTNSSGGTLEMGSTIGQPDAGPMGNGTTVFYGGFWAGELQPPPCPADYNMDGGIDGQDVQAFYADWELGLTPADVNQDGGVDGADVQFFFEVWEAGGC